MAVSPDNIIAEQPSTTAFVMSLISAFVGKGAEIIVCSISCGYDRRLARLARDIKNSLLKKDDRLDVGFNRKIAPVDHDRIRGLDDLLKIREAALVFDLRLRIRGKSAPTIFLTAST